MRMDNSLLKIIENMVVTVTWRSAGVQTYNRTHKCMEQPLYHLLYISFELGQFSNGKPYSVCSYFTIIR